MSGRYTLWSCDRESCANERGFEFTADSVVKQAPPCPFCGGEMGAHDFFVKANRVEQLEREVERLTEAVTTDPAKWSFQTLVLIAQRLLDYDYPDDVFTGLSDDAGVVFVRRLSEAIQALPSHARWDRAALAPQRLPGEGKQE